MRKEESALKKLAKAKGAEGGGQRADFSWAVISTTLFSPLPDCIGGSARPGAGARKGLLAAW